MITTIDEEGAIEIDFSREVLVPASDDQARYIRILTYQYAIELSIEADGVVVRGEPYVREKFEQDAVPSAAAGKDEEIEKTSGRREMQSYGEAKGIVSETEKLYDDRFNAYAKRFDGFTEAQDENEIFFAESRSFNFSIAEMTSSKLKLVMNFEQPEMISSYDKDKLSMHINRPELLLRSQDDQTKFTETPFSIAFDVPKQLSDNLQSVESFKAAA